MVLDSMVAHHVAWVPTLDIYEASRDLQRARTQPWFTDYLHPTLEEYFRPDPSNHGSYFFGWTSTDETYWKEHKAAPKLFVSLEAARKLWGGPFGDLTSIRIPAAHAEMFKEELRKQIDPAAMGMAFRPVKAEQLVLSVSVSSHP